jgi:hypothetical protein
MQMVSKFNARKFGDVERHANRQINSEVAFEQALKRRNSRPHTMGSLLRFEQADLGTHRRGRLSASAGTARLQRS